MTRIRTAASTLLLSLLVAVTWASANSPSGGCYRFVFFAAGSAELSKFFKDALDSLMTTCAFVRQPDVVVLVVGHTDSLDGTPDNKMAISRARAEVVKDYLVSKGIDRQSIHMEAVGDTKPLVFERPNMVESDHSQNRLVEVYVQRKQPPAEGAPKE